MATTELRKPRKSRNRLLPSTMARGRLLLHHGLLEWRPRWMVASQKFPELFDGVISQNPGFNLPQAAVAEAWNEQALAPLATHTDVNGQPYIPDTFPPQDLEVASAAILNACDALDGLVDGIIDDYHACTKEKVFPALDAYTCGKGQHATRRTEGHASPVRRSAPSRRFMQGPKIHTARSFTRTGSGMQVFGIRRPLAALALPRGMSLSSDHRMPTPPSI